MILLNDGRTELYQWDTGRSVLVDDECDEIHYGNKVFGRSIDVEVENGVAKIPDELLQTSGEITAWGYVGSPENGYTKISKKIKVLKRNKPSDYVFTPTEQITLETVLNRLDELEEQIDPESVKKYVDDSINDSLKQAKDSGEFEGEPGHTPEKGVDYWTESDKAEIVADVLEELPVWDGGSY